eukprot:11240826-Ditylum_brightwellii.AAC.1
MVAAVEDVVMVSSNEADIKAALSMTSINMNMNDDDDKGVMIILFASTNSGSGGSCGTICDVQTSEFKGKGIRKLKQKREDCVDSRTST